MLYCRTINVEHIAVHPMDDTTNTQFVELTKYGDEPVFAVSMYDGEFDWCWEFDMFIPSDYERVKFAIFDALIECDTMVELAECLDETFHVVFEDILMEDECDGMYAY